MEEIVKDVLLLKEWEEVKMLSLRNVDIYRGGKECDPKTRAGVWVTSLCTTPTTLTLSWVPA